MNNPDALPDLKPDNKNSFSVPTPPAPDMGMRTMSSDASSLRTPGGASAEPKAFNPKDLLGSEPVFNPAGNNPNDNFSLPPEPPKSKKGLIIGIGVAVFVILVGVVGYFILWPIIKSTFLAPAPVPPVPVPVVVIPPPPAPEPIPPPPAPPAFQHTTLFPQASAVSSVSVAVSALSIDAVNAGLKTSFGPAIPVPAFNEVLFSFNSNIVDAYQFLGTLIPGIAGSLNSTIAQDFTSFVYKDKDGIWPGYVFTLSNANASAEPTLGFVNAIQTSASLFYTSDPGAQKSDFKTGSKPSANFVWVKYKPYTVAGASFNIGQATMNGNNYLIVSTSYQGFQMVSQKLAF